MGDTLKQLIKRYEAANFTVNKRMNGVVKELLPSYLTTEQFSTLRYIQNFGPCTSSELADAFCVGKSTITAIITRLADKKLIERDRDEDDRRVVYLSLTEEGIKLFDEIDVEINEVVASYLNNFNSNEIERFIQSLEKLANLMQQDEEGEDKNE